MKGIFTVSLSALCAFVVIFVFTGCNRQDKGDQEKVKVITNNQKVTNVAIKKIVPTTISESVTLPAAVEPWEEITLGAEIEGKVEWIGRKEGEQVEKGELLLKIDIEVLKTAAENAETHYRLALDKLTRREKLFTQHVISQEMFDEARAGKDTALNALEMARINLAKGHISVPIDGYLNKLYIDEGEFIRHGDPVADLIQIDPVRIIAGVPEMDVPYVKQDKEVKVVIDALDGLVLSGRIYFVSFKADDTRTFPVKAVVKNENQKIKPGMIARMTIVRKVAPKSMVVPLYSIMERAGERVVFVEEEGMAKLRKIEFGIISSDRVQITRGLKFGENLIIKGQRELEDGDKVKVAGDSRQ